MKNKEQKKLDERIDEIIFSNTSKENLKTKINHLKITRNMYWLIEGLYAISTGINIGKLVLNPNLSRAFMIASNTSLVIFFSMMARLRDTELDGLNSEYKKLIKQ